jgi:hypothetical protein
MAMVAVTSNIIINCPKEKVTEFAANPDNVPKWYVHIQSLEWRTPRPLQNGSELQVNSRFLHFVHKVVEFIPGQKLILRSVDAPSRGIPEGLAKLLAPFMAMALKFINRKDLKHLKQLLERPSPTMQVV